MIINSSWSLLGQVVCSVLATALAVVAATWSKSPVYLPLPSGPYSRWLRGVPVLATAAILVILNTWFTDCNYLWFLTTLLISAIILCGALVVVHHHLLVSREIPQASTLLVIICLGWSILGNLSVSSAASIVIAKQRMDEAYKKTPLTLWHI